MSELVKYKKFAVGYDRTERSSFRDLILPYLAAIKEVYFSWPGMVSGRALRDDGSVDKEKEILLSDLNWCRANGVGLDLLFNANCYGHDDYGENLRNRVYEVLEELKQNGLFPEVVTTTSQYIAKVIKCKYPEVDIRASINMRIESTKSMEKEDMKMHRCFYENQKLVLMPYDEFDQDGLYIVSCVVENGCKAVIDARFKQLGMFSSLNSVKGMIAVRTIWKSNHFDRISNWRVLN